MKSKLKTFFSLALIFLAVVFSTRSVDASIIAISKSGQIMVKVLSAQTTDALIKDDSRSNLEVTKIQNLDLNDPGVAISNENGKVNMTVLSDGTYRELDVTGITDDLVEIEQRPEVQKMTISVDEYGFNLKQGSFTAKTLFPLEVDAKTARFALTTEKGKEFVSVLPVEAVESALRSGLMTKITDNNIGIASANDNLSYQVSGEKVFNIFNLTEYSLPVSISVSVGDGHIVSVDSPSPVYKVIKIFFI